MILALTLLNGIVWQQPQSMLDADFEYGLQPTKWQAIAVARGYPSIYEIPGTDQDVTSIFVRRFCWN